MESIIALVGLAVLAVPVLLLVALVGLSNLKGRVNDLEAELRRLKAQLPMQAGHLQQPNLASRPGAPVATQPSPAPASPAPVTVAQPPTTEAAEEPIASAKPVVRAEPSTSASIASETISPREAVAPAEPAKCTATTTPVSGPTTATTAPPAVDGPQSTDSTRPVLEPASVPLGQVQRPPLAPPPPDAIERLATSIKQWFTEGNVPVKVGMLVLLVGIGSLLKYAGDRGWLTIPISMRLVGVAAAALGALTFAWRKRESHRSFSLVVQGGSIGVLLLVVFAAFKLYDLMPAGLAFALTVTLVAALGVLALLQDAPTLAVFGILAGFLAPIWLSTGSGNHVVLFTYYAVLNVAIFAITLRKTWRGLTLLGWAFTWGIGITWGVSSYTPVKYASTQPFLLLFFALYLVLPLLEARRRAPGTTDGLDGFLLFGTPLVAFSAQAALLEGQRMQLALCAVALAAIYGGLWWWQRRGPHPLLGAAYGLLAAGFSTLAVPLALSARATSAVFAVEGAALVWLGLRRNLTLSRWTGLGLQVAAAISFAVAIFNGSLGRGGPFFANPHFAGALLIAVAAFACAWWYRGAERRISAFTTYAWGLAWWCGNVFCEVDQHLDAVFRADAMLVAIAVTALLAAEAHRRRPSAALTLTVLGAFALAATGAFAQVDVRGQPLMGWGAAAWLVVAACGVRSLACLRGSDAMLLTATHAMWWLLWPLVFSLSAVDLARGMALGSGWRVALAGVPWLGLLALVRYRWSWLRRPLASDFVASRGALLGIALAVVATGWLLALANAGDSAPLPWIALLNPLDLAQAVALALAAGWLWSDLAPKGLAQHRVGTLAFAGLVLATCITLRAVHHWGGIPWDAEMGRASVTQTSLTLVWSVLGVAGWIVGSRRGQRALWLAGAVLMALVLAKLVLVDRRHLGDLLGIGSFLAFGLMCTIVGWFAPAPPRERGETPDPG